MKHEKQKQLWTNLEDHAESVAWELVIGNYDVPITSTYMIERINEIKTPEHVWMKNLVNTPT